ncbi:unnamed protein product [Cuscuta epithymum]|uniref:Uncharacterized protein n=1 Tax=Cuscuta epithymum TaxID=186058 RepID=A0AAV0CP36_9ASTE|nr:unnamed protein product [Cuscuta epithymum]
MSNHLKQTLVRGHRKKKVLQKMVKTTAGGSALAVHHTKKKRRPVPERRRSFKKRVFDYLFSDDYMFAPLLSLHSSIVSSSSFGIGEPLSKEKEEDFVGKVVDYMRSDCYLYSPMVITQPWLTSSVQCPPPANKTGLHHILEKIDTVETGDLLKEGDQTDHPVEKISKDQNTDSCHPFDLSRTRIKSTSLRQERVKHVILQPSHPLTP